MKNLYSFITKLCFCVFLLTVLPVFSYAQQTNYLDNFSRLEAEGPLPQDLLNIAKDKNFDGTRSKNKIQKEQNKYIKSLILEGKILYGDELTLYVRSILDNLLAKEPDLKKQIKLYGIKSTQANAFITADGFLFVTLGFISQTTNEAEIAYVLSHELIHYTDKHAYEEPKEQSKGFETITDYLKYHSRSRTQELQCDREGYTRFFAPAGYSASAVESMFDVLQYSYLPFDEVKMTKEDFQAPCYQFKDSYFLENLTPITSRQDYIDTFSTHPNLSTRRLEMQKIIHSSANSGSQTFLLPTQSFERARALARFELINEQIAQDDYVKAFYNTFVLLKKYPANTFLRTAQIASVYGISKAKTYGNYSSYQLVKKDVQGQMQFAANVFEKMTKKEAAVFALRYCYDGMKNLPNKRYFTLLFNDIALDMAKEMDITSLNYFSDVAQGEPYSLSQDTNTKDTNINSAEQTKYDKIKRVQSVKSQPDFKTDNYMLCDLKKDTAFGAAFERAWQENQAKQVDNIIESVGGQKAFTSGEKILVLEPQVLKVQKKDEQNVILNPGASQRLAQSIKSIAKTCGVDARIVSATEWDTTLTYQNRAKLQEFVFGLNRYSQIGYQNRYAESLAQDLGVDYINLVVNKQQTDLRQNTYYKRLYTLFSIPAYPFLPLALAQWVPSVRDNSMAFMVYDLKNNAYAKAKSIDFESEGTSDAQNQALYKLYSGKKNPKGYLDRRFTLFFEAQLRPSWFEPNYNGNKGFFRFDYMFSPNVEFAIGKKISVGAGYSFSHTRFYAKHYQYAALDFYNQDYTYNGHMSIHGANAFVKFYTSKDLNYFHKLQGDVFKYTYNKDNSSWTGGVSYQFGKQVYLNKYLCLQTGLSMGVLFSGYSFASIEDVRQEGKWAATKLLSMYVFGLHLSIGFMPF